MECLPDIEVLFSQVLYIALPFVTTVLALGVLHMVAPTLGIVDHPDARKQHVGAIPLIGGPAIFIAAAVSAGVLMPQFHMLLFLVLAGVLVVLGMLDDRFNLPVAPRTVVQAFVALAMAQYAGVQIVEIGNLFGFGNVTFTGYVSQFFTVVCIIGVINAINMVDGVDGLAGTIILISLLAMCWLSLQSGDFLSAKMLAVFIGALVAFLLFNSRLLLDHARIFFGDSGSMLLGFVLVWFFIKLTQGEGPSGNGAPISPVVAGWLFGLPLADTISVMVGRLRRGHSPVAAGRDHFHHLLLDSGFSVNATVSIMALIHALMVATGLLLNPYPAIEPLLFCGFVALVVAHHFITPRLLEHYHHRYTSELINNRH